MGTAGENALGVLEDRLGHRFERRELLERAVTHRSFANERGTVEHYERLEFLGDSVLGLLAAEWLFRRHPDLAEGQLSKLKAVLVSEPVLARWASRLGVGEALRLGVGEERSGGREKPSLLADALEALLGAVHLDGGLEATRRVVAPLLEEAMAELPGASHDAKTRLQELAQARGLRLPEYRHVRQEGPDHRKRFTAECWVDGQRVGVGAGHSKKLAEQRAAAGALLLLEDA